MVQHITHPNESRIMSQQEITEKYHVRCNFLEALTIRQSIPFDWRSRLTTQFTPEVHMKHEFVINTKKLNIIHSGPKQRYSDLVYRTQTPFNRLESWQRELSNSPQQKFPDWDKEFLIPYTSTRETKLQSFVFKILYRLTPCNKHLHKLRIKDSHICSFCNQVDNITHFFYECCTVTPFWSDLTKWCKRYLDIHLDRISIPEILLGVTRKLENTRVINFVITQAKFYIQKRKLFHHANIALVAFLAEVRSRLFTEKQICRLENKPNKFCIWR